MPHKNFLQSMLLRSLICALLFYPYLAFTNIIQQSRYWLDLNATGNIYQQQNFLYVLNIQNRFATQNVQYEHSLFVGGLGYQLLPNLSVWMGAQWNTPNYLTHAGSQNRIWQQIILSNTLNNTINIFWRTRLEERKQEGQPQWSPRLRERITVSLPNKICDKFSPIVYDEIFFNLTSPAWVNSRGIDQNRLFLGIDIPISENTFWQVGYLNQYRWTLPNNIDAHILAISFNIVT